MFLKSIKLAGFKSFAEPAQIPVSGRLVGVVGPNGCGKSNVIDAVRWVLGEAQAKHLRGETMQDVIFSGTTGRPALARASVELSFDNSLGRAPGVWSQYGEISVRRVLERDGDSAYFINGTRVRRRDVQDIFLGTGLGPRAYAIIEQGMISRVIESRPEELRVFLEEAAGVSKYKERRRETENRLSDARANLERTDDVVRELDAQLERLAGQAEVAARYRALQEDLTRANALLWAARRRDAAKARERFARELARVAEETEAQTATLRAAEADIERLREDAAQAQERVEQAQGALYAASAELARVEQQLQFMRESMRRLRERRAEIERDRDQTSARRDQIRDDLARARAAVEAAEELVRTRATMLEREQLALPQADQRHRAAQAASSEVEREIARIDQERGLATAQVAHARRALEQLAQRTARLTSERDSLALVPEEDVQRAQAALAQAQERNAAVRAEIDRLRAATPAVEQHHQAAQKRAQELTTAFTKADAQRQAAERLQARVASDAATGAFLERHGLAQRRRLWQEIQVEAGWEDAIEGVLGMRLNAVALDGPPAPALFEGEPPPAGLALYWRAEAESVASGGNALAERVTSREGHGALAVREWLQGIDTVDDWRAALAAAWTLPPGNALVSRDGHVVTRAGVSFFAPQAQIHGALARAREVESLTAQCAQLSLQAESARAEVAEAERQVRSQRERLQQAQAEASEAQAAHHQAQLEAVRLGERRERGLARQQQIERELGEIDAQREVEALHVRESSYAIEQSDRAREQADARSGEARRAFAEATRALEISRAGLQAAQQAAQEAQFLVRQESARVQTLERTEQETTARQSELDPALATVERELAAIDEAGCAAEVERSLARRAECERELAALRGASDQASQTLRSRDEVRMTAQAALEPLREKAASLRLEEQEARINEAQASEQLARHADESRLAELAQELDRGRRPSALQADISTIESAIEALGAVNLAALSELETARARKTWLDAQKADLDEAVQTLEAAIRRIDRETRDQLQSTFDRVNANFSTMFPSLFGGGQARLVLTGEEILDAGIQVIAQPPGKKTTSIHLLSGGEKALTAASLVFSLFRLNPAPFCLLDEVDAPLDDTNTQRFCDLVRQMAEQTQFLFISHNKIAMEMAEQLIGITMQESGVSRVVAVDIEEALRMRAEAA